MFKFVDPDNFLALELNHNDSGKIRLVKVADGAGTNLGEIENIMT